MPQTTYLSVYRADYPILAKAQKPGGVTVLSVVTSNDVPNKHVWAAGTVQMTQILGLTEEEQAKVLAENEERVQANGIPRTQAEVEEAEMEDVEEEQNHEPPTNGRRRRR